MIKTSLKELHSYLKITR